MGSELMKRIYFLNHRQLSKYMISVAQEDIYVVAVLFYDDAKQLLRELLKDDKLDIQAIDMQPEMYNGYDREYYISIYDMHVSVEPAYYDGEYLTTDAELTLVHSDACSAAIKDIPHSQCREICIGEINENDSCEISAFLDDFFDNVEILRDNQGNITGVNFRKLF